MSYEFQKEYELLIGGQWVKAENGATFETHNPATGELLALCANASAGDVDKAVKAAQKAFVSWSKTSASERAALLLKIADLIEGTLRISLKSKRAITAKLFAKVFWSTFPLLPIIFFTLPGAPVPKKARQP